jgi:hypothetical protein
LLCVIGTTIYKTLPTQRTTSANRKVLLWRYLPRKPVRDSVKMVMGQTYSAASQGAKDFNIHLIEITQKNMNAAFDLARQLASVKTPSEFIELSSAHVRKKFEVFAEQTQQLTTSAQKMSDQASQQLQKRN